jgi:hypothetical protein
MLCGPLGQLKKGENMGYFEFIQRVALEKNHSAVIAWLLSNSNKYLSDKQKKNILKELFGVETDTDTIEVYTEYKGIDILFVIGSNIIAIENKIKIGEHDNQLDIYNSILKKDFPEHYILNKFFLSLIGEKPIDDQWKILTYDEILDCIKPYSKQSEIINDYIQNLIKLVGVKNKFNEDHRKFPNVFSDGSKRKNEKIDKYKYSDDLNYISSNNLETIFQRYFFYKIMDNMNFKCKIKKVGETRGVALIDIKNPDQLPNIKINGSVIDIGIQIQGNTIKIQFENGFDVNGNRKKQDPNLLKVLNNSIGEIYNLVDKSKWRLNKPKTANSAYYSISKKIEFMSGDSFVDNDFENCINSVKKEYQKCIEIL